ncbi:ABC transporter ATP-binding protein [Eubacteriales bacterium OttesenSCG-928-A19]|nr:ABC transporter ATP-binding protein [Eubacteriales bacterium OttesenSCG-928-A19]
MSRIELSHIDKYYGNNHVLKDLSLTIEDGDFMTLLGPSGCGKTTTLRVLSGLEKPQNGTMLMDGRTVIDCDVAYYMEPGKRELNLVFQSYALWPHMTVFENVAFGLKIKKLKKEQISRMVMGSLEKMKIAEYRDRYPSELSGGQQQRVAMARAIASEAKLLLLDEPLSNLDAKLRIDMRAELKRLHNEMGTTIVYVTHDQIEALTMSTKIALFSAGELTQVAPPLELYMNPATLMAADFIGNPRINFLEGKAELNGGKLTAHCSLGSFTFEGAELVDGIPASSFDCVFGLRPEQVSVFREQEPGTIEASVYADQPAGSETLVTLVLGKDEFLAKQIGIQQYTINQPVYLRIDPAKLNIYDKASGRLVKLAV